MSNLVDAARTYGFESPGLTRSVNKEQVSTCETAAEMQNACVAATLVNHATAVEELVDSGCWISPDIVCAAVEGKSKDVIDTLIAKGWDVNLNLGHMGDALIIATGSDDLEMVQFLLSRGADPNANTDGGMYRAVEQGAAMSSIPVLEALLNAGAETEGRSVISKAACWGRTDVVAFLLDRGVALDAVPDNDDLLSNAWERGVKNALCTAAWRGKADVVKLLLNRGADTGVKDSLGRSALELAEAERREECVHLLKYHMSLSGDI